MNSIFYYVLTQIRVRMYVSIQIGKDESGYEAIQQFIAAKTAQVKNLRDVEGRCIHDDMDDNDMQRPSPPPKLRLFPCKYLGIFQLF